MTTTLQGLQGLHEHPVGLRTGPVRTVTRNYTERGRAGRTGRTSTSGGRRLPQLALRGLVPLLLLVVWQLSDTLEWVDARTLPSPLAILEAYRELWAAGDLQAALPISLQRAGIGLAVGGGTGLLLGVLAGLFVTAERAYDAPLQMLRTIPFIALVPLFVVWFGIGETSKIALIIGASIFPVYLNTYHAIRGIDPKLLEVGRTFGMGRAQTIRRVVIPMAMPGILVGWRYAAGVALLGLVAAEQINSQAGLGYILNTANQFQRTDIILAGILVYAVLGLVVDLVMRALELALLPWRPQHDSE
ncbi:ABC transporter permease [Nocardioides campestrisoli]|uniref:ABC transporter permease n=1 Tax=Nocardioides campestrisoli TaxID=2736757 RepID=UPI00163DAE25|nr:ABC transporter permease [Nocardioides campestrisoli]